MPEPMRRRAIWLGIVLLIVVSIAKRPSQWMRGPSESYVLGASDLASARFGLGFTTIARLAIASRR